MQQPSDEDLVREIARRDHAAFGVLVDRHMKRVASLAQNILRSAADADEVAQETFLRLWERPGRFDPGKARFATWLYRVVVNACLDRRRARRFDPLDAAAEPPARRSKTRCPPSSSTPPCAPRSPPCPCASAARSRPRWHRVAARRAHEPE